MSDLHLKPAKPKKDSTLTMRLTKETRQALEDCAAKEGRSVSELAERWLDDARFGRASIEELLGGFGIAETLRAMAAFGKRVRAEVGPPEEDYFAREALKEGWRHMLDKALPFTPGTPAMAEWFQLDQTTIPTLAANAAKALRALPTADPARVAAEAKRTRTTYPQAGILGQGLHFASPALAPVEEVVGPSLLEELDQASEPFRAPWDLRDRAAEAINIESLAVDALKALLDALDRAKACRELFGREQALAVQKGRALVGAVAGADRLPQLSDRGP